MIDPEQITGPFELALASLKLGALPPVGVAGVVPLGQSGEARRGLLLWPRVLATNLASRVAAARVVSARCRAVGVTPDICLSRNQSRARARSDRGFESNGRHCRITPEGVTTTSLLLLDQSDSECSVRIAP